MSNAEKPDLENLFPKVRVVLVETTHPGNIGAAARAMESIGLARLVLVKPRLDMSFVTPLLPFSSGRYNCLTQKSQI